MTLMLPRHHSLPHKKILIFLIVFKVTLLTVVEGVIHVGLILFIIILMEIVLLSSQSLRLSKIFKVDLSHVNGQTDRAVVNPPELVMNVCINNSMQDCLTD